MSSKNNITKTSMAAPVKHFDKYIFLKRDEILESTNA